MSFADASMTSLRVFQEVAERGTLTAAAAALGYTQSAVSRQIASLERAAGVPLMQRRHNGVQLTAAGHTALRRAAAIIAQVDAATRELSGMPDERGTVHLGWFTSAGTALLPQALTALRRTHPAITVITREGSTPALVRALRAGTIDIALLASTPPFRPPDTETPALDVQTITERSLRVAIPSTHPLARHDFVDVNDLHDQPWIASPGADTGMGVWPGLDERPQIVHTARDWLAKLHLVAAGCGLTTIPAALHSALPPGVRILPVRGGPQEHRRILIARLPGPIAEAHAVLAHALRGAAIDDDENRAR